MEPYTVIALYDAMNLHQIIWEKIRQIRKFTHCDTSNNTLKAFVQAVYDLKPDFIVWTRDNTEHNNWNSTQEEVYEATSAIKEALDEIFANNIPVYPVIGNHENYPNDLWESGNVQIFENLANIYKDYFFETQAYESFSKYGHYTELHPEQI